MDEIRTTFSLVELSFESCMRNPLPQSPRLCAYGRESRAIEVRFEFTGYQIDLLMGKVRLRLIQVADTVVYLVVCSGKK